MYFDGYKNGLRHRVLSVDNQGRRLRVRSLSLCSSLVKKKKIARAGNIRRALLRNGRAPRELHSSSARVPSDYYVGQSGVGWGGVVWYGMVLVNPPCLVLLVFVWASY